MIAPNLLAANEGEHVILLHGLCRTPRSMSKMARELKNACYTVANVGYPSREKTIQELTDEFLSPAIRDCVSKGARQIHFVTHSMGGILVRDYLSRNSLPCMGKLVMLAPPNDGSEVADRLRHMKLYQWINGPAGQQLGTDTDSLPRQLGAVTFPTGVIAGDRSINWINSMVMIQGKDDGKVSVSRSRVDGMADHLVVHVSHPMIMRNRTVIQQTLHFLKLGKFASDQ